MEAARLKLDQGRFERILRPEIERQAKGKSLVHRALSSLERVEVEGGGGYLGNGVETRCARNKDPLAPAPQFASHGDCCKANCLIASKYCPSHAYLDGANPAEEGVTLRKGRDALFRGAHQAHKLLLQPLRDRRAIHALYSLSRRPFSGTEGHRPRPRRVHGARSQLVDRVRTALKRCLAVAQYPARKSPSV